jgi:hypothetical protein
VDWVADHIVVLAAIVLGVLVVLSLCVMVPRLLGLLRTVKASRRRVEERLTPIQAEAARIEDALARITTGQGELQAEVAVLQRRVAELKVLLSFGSAALETLRSPLRYLGL